MSFSKKLTKKSKKWRGALICLTLFGVAPTVFGAETRDVSNYDELRSAISEFNANTGEDFKIFLKNDIPLQGILPSITGNRDLVGVDSGSLEIVGDGHALDGRNAYRGLFVDMLEAGGTVTVSDVVFANCHAAGGDGGDGAAGAGGGMGAGAALYAYSGDVVLKNVTAANSSVKGGDGGSVMQDSASFAGGGGVGGNGGNGVVYETGAADGGGIFTDGANSTTSRVAGDGGVTSETEPSSFGHYVDKTTPVGGDSLSGGGGGGSIALGGDGGFGGGGGAGGTFGGDGGFGGGGAGGADELSAGLGGFGGGNGGYVETVTSEQFSDTQGGGTGGGGAALGAAIFVGEDAIVTVSVDKDGSNGIYGGSLTAGVGGGGTAQDGEAIGKGLFLLNDLTIEVAEGGEYYVSDSIGGYAGSANAVADNDGNYENMSGVTKTGEGTLYLNATDSSYAGDTTVKGGKLVATQQGAISSHSALNLDGGSVELRANQSIKGLSGGEDGLVDLKGSTLAITGDDDSNYAGVVTGDGLLLKQGSGTLTLSGDSRLVGSEGVFNTEIQSGTIRVENDGAFGGGKVFYTRTDRNDQTSAIEFGSNVDLANDVVLSGNSVPMILTGTSATLSGQVSTRNSSASTVELRLDSGSTLTVANTGVTKDSEGVATVGKTNNVNAYTLVSGNLAAKVSSFAESSGDEDARYWYSSIGNATITNKGESTLSFFLDTDDLDEGLKFANNLIIESGGLTIGQTLVDGDVTQVNKILYSGNTSGDGVWVVDIGDGATIYATGSLGHAETLIRSGTLNVAESADPNVDLGKLSAEGGIIEVGTKDVVVNIDGDSETFDGTIRADGEGTTFYKYGTGAYTLNLTNDSNVKSIQIVEGTLSLGENHYDGGLYLNNDFEMELWSAGRFLLSTTDGATLKLNNFVAATPGSVLEIGEKDELVLTNQNSSTTIAANLAGSGWLFLENVTDEEGNVDPWVLRGNNSDWSGNVALFDNNARLKLASANAGSANSTINFGALGALDVAESTTVGTLNFDNNLAINVASGKTLSLNNLSSAVMWLDDSVLTIDGGGTVKLGDGAGKAYYGETLVTNGSTLALVGDATAGTEYGAERRATTLTNGGTLLMDYTGQGPDGTWTSLWGSDINVDGDGAIVVKDALKRQTNENGGSSFFAGTVNMDEKISFLNEDRNELTFNVDNSYATVQLHSLIEGRGDLVKTGAGTLILDGTGEFGSASVQSGILQLGTGPAATNDQLAFADVTINGGTLAGWTDSLGSVNLQSGVLNMLKTGTVTLNDSESALTMDGGTVYVNVLDADNYTNFQTADENATVAINGGAFYVDTSASESELSSGSTFTILSTGEGNLIADKSNILIYDDISGKRFVVDPDSLDAGKLTFLLSDSRFSDAATSPNEKAVGEYLDSWLDSGEIDADTNDVLNELETVVASDPHVLNQLSGELRFSTFKAQVHAHNLIRQTLTQNILPDSTAGVSLSAIRGQAYDDATDGLTGWATAFGASGEADDHRGTSGYDFNLLGGMVGLEVGSTATNQFGFFFAYDNLQLDAKSALGKVKLNEEQFGTYLRFSDAYGYTFATGTIGISDYDLSRAIRLPNYTPLKYNGSTGGWSGGAYIERGFTFTLPGSDLQPYGGLQYTHLHADKFSEGGSLRTLGIKSSDAEYNSLEGVLGVRWLKSTLVGARQFDFNAYGNWTHEFLDSAPDGYIALAGRPDGTIHVVGNSVGRDWIYAGLGGKLHVNDVFSVYGGADVQVNKYTTYVNGHAGMSYTW